MPLARRHSDAAFHGASRPGSKAAKAGSDSLIAAQAFEKARFRLANMDLIASASALPTHS